LLLVTILLLLDYISKILEKPFIQLPLLFF